jgi:hypothetical protein
MSSNYENELYMSALPQEQSQETVNHAEIKQNYLARKLKALALSTLATVGTMGAVTMNQVQPAEAFCPNFLGFGCNENAPAGTVYNEKLSDLSNEDLGGYCDQLIARQSRYQSTFEGDFGNFYIRRGDKVTCVQKKYLKTTSNGGFDIGGSFGVPDGNGNGKVTGSRTYESGVTSYVGTSHLNNVCRDKHPTYEFPNQYGVGRVFVGDGGYSCYQTKQR